MSIDGWVQIPMGKTCNITTGKKDVNEGDPKGDYPFFTCSRTNTFSNSYSFDADAILIAGNGEVGNLHRYKGKFEAYQRTYVLDEFTHRIDYIFQYIAAFLKQELLRGHVGSTIPFIKLKDLTEFQLRLPISKSEQAKIAEALSTVGRAIEQTEALIAKQQRIKTGLMQDLLTRGIDKHGNLRSEKTHQFKDSPLGRIPVEWNVKRMDQLLIQKQYGISTSLNVEPIGVPVLRMNNLVEGEVDYSDLKYSAGAGALKVLLRDGDVLFNRTNSIDYVGRTGIYRHRGNQVSFASYLVRLIPKSKELSAEYLNLWLNDVANQIRVKQFATIGVQQANVNPTNLGTLEMAYPIEVSEQDRICNAIESSRRNLRITDIRFRKLSSLKTALMQDLLTGKVRVTPLLTEPQKASA